MRARRIWIAAREWRTRALLRALLLERGADAIGMETLAEALGPIEAGGVRPDVLVVDLAGCTWTAGDVARLDELAEAPPPAVLVVAGANEAATLGLDGLRHAVPVRRPVALGDLAERVLSAADGGPKSGVLR